MAAGQLTQGRRRPDGTEPHEMEPGDYALASPEAQVVWLVNPDNSAGHVTANRWTILVEEDGTVTVKPSIFWDSQGVPPGWHGYLERGVWREA